MGKLTSKQLENLKEPGTYEDGDGLRIVVKASGRKSWVLRYQLNGRRREMGLGAFPEVSLKAARLEASAQRSQLFSKIDPLAAREAEREALRAAQHIQASKAMSFDVLAAEYIAAHRAGWKSPKHAQQWENTLKTYASPIIGRLSVSDIGTAYVLEVLNKKDFWTSKPETANRVRNRIELILDAAKARGLREGENPARWRGHLDKLLPRRSKVQAVKHHTALPHRDAPAFMAQLRGAEDVTSKAMQMTILTGCRTSEVLNATWDEINTDAKIWTIPAVRMKGNREHRVPLTDAVLSLLESLPRVCGNPYLFAGMRRGRPLSNMAMLMGLRRMNRADLTMHGFRSTFRDWAGECTSHPRDVCEQALAHSLGNAVEAAYRRGDLFEKRRVLMADWAAYCTSIASTNVIQGDFKRA